VDQDAFNLVCLLDLDANSDGVDTRLDKDSLVLVTRNRQRSEKNLWRRLGFDLWDIVPLGSL
jgi:hypothetical protein